MANPYPVSGVIKDENGVALVGATIEVLNATTGEYVSSASTTNGEFVVDLAKLASGYSNLDLCFLRASTNVPERYTQDFRFIIDTTLGFFEKNMVAYYVVQRIREKDPRDVLQYAFEPVSGALRIIDAQGAIQTFIYNAEYDENNNTLYGAFAKPGTKDTEAGWRIVKYTYDSNNNNTKTRFANGDSSFGWVWNDRATYTYE